MSFWETASDAWDGVSGFFGKSDNLKALGSLGGALASIYQTKETSDTAKDFLNFDKKRINRNIKDRAKKQEAYESIWLTKDDKENIEIGGAGG